MPLSRLLKLTAHGLADTSDSPIPTVIGHVSAGHPLEVADEHEFVDLNKLVRSGSAHTMIVDIDGDSMCPEIDSGDKVVLALDRVPKPNNIIITRLYDGYTIKRFKLNHGHRRGFYLVPANPSYQTREIVPADDAAILGVITWILKKVA